MTGRGIFMGFEAWRSLAAALHGAGDRLAARLAAGPAPAIGFTGLGRPPACLECGDAELARELYRGHFAFAGQARDCQPDEVFRLAPPSPAWATELAGFAWLAHFETAGLALYRSFARAMVLAWDAHGRSLSRDSDSARLMSFSRHAGFLLSGAPAEFERRFLAVAAREARRVLGQAERQGYKPWAALLAAGLTFRGGEDLRDRAMRGLAAAVQAALLPDGGPTSRNPQDLLGLLVDVVPLRDALVARRLAVPPALAAGLERAVPMLRMLCHGDGGLALFQGADDIRQAAVGAVLERDDVAGGPLAHAPHSGYCRLAQGPTVVIADCGPARGCDSRLAFEFSDGPHRIVGNCGTPRHASAAWREAAKSPAAHSTLDRAACGGAAEAEVMVSPQGALLSARGTGHERRLYLAAGGHDFRGEDRFDVPAADFVLRFHLHPSVRAWQDRKGANIVVMVPQQAAWKFTARGGSVSLEDSLFLATGGAPRECRQIVVRGQAQRVNWAFKKLDRKPRRRQPAESAPRLPF